MFVHPLKTWPEALLPIGRGIKVTFVNSTSMKGDAWNPYLLSLAFLDSLFFSPFQGISGLFKSFSLPSQAQQELKWGKLLYLQLGLFAYSWAFFAYSPLRCFFRNTSPV